jgi:hypothetical protein
MEVPHSLRTDKSFRTRFQVRCHGHIDEVEVAGSSFAAASLMTIQVMAPKCFCARNKYSEVLDIHLAVICVLTVCRHRVMLRFSSLIVSSVVVMATGWVGVSCFGFGHLDPLPVHYPPVGAGTAPPI